MVKNVIKNRRFNSFPKGREGQPTGGNWENKLHLSDNDLQLDTRSREEVRHCSMLLPRRLQRLTHVFLRDAARIRDARRRNGRISGESGPQTLYVYMQTIQTTL